VGRIVRIYPSHREADDAECAALAAMLPQERAVLAHLTRGEDIVVVATHDLELIELLGSSYSPYHFREHVSEESLSFDFVIRAGPSSTRNAIALLKLMDYPDDVVAAALEAVRRTAASEDRTPEV